MNTFFLTRQFFGEKWPKFGSKSGSKFKKMAQKKIKLAKMVAKEKKILVQILHTYPKTLNSPFCYLLICLNIDV